MADDEFVSIYFARSPGEADIVRLALEDEGIAACIVDKQLAGLSRLLEFHVLVKRADESRARVCLADRLTTDAPDPAFEQQDSASDEMENAHTDGAETPAILSRLRSLLHLRRARPAWLRWLVE
jgi:hypothetical protein